MELNGSEKKVENLQQEYAYPMKWHKFLIWAGLFLSCLANVIYAAQYLTGQIYIGQGNHPTLMYAYYPQMQTADTIYAALLAVSAVFSLYVRWRLAGLKADGPKLLMLNYVLGIATALVYLFLCANASGISFGTLVQTSNFLSKVIGTAVGVWLNWIYYKKRKALFVN